MPNSVSAGCVTACKTFCFDIGEVAHEDDEEDVPMDIQGPDIGVLVRLYAIHSKYVKSIIVIELLLCTVS